MEPQEDKGSLGKLLTWLASFLEIFQSRTRTSAIMGVIAYFLARFNIPMDEAAATEAVTNAATQIKPDLTIQDLIVVGIGALVTYFHAKQKVMYVEKQPGA